MSGDGESKRFIFDGPGYVYVGPLQLDAINFGNLTTKMRAIQ
jgi:hypothetical protein